MACADAGPCLLAQLLPTELPTTLSYIKTIQTAGHFLLSRPCKHNCTPLVDASLWYASKVCSLYGQDGMKYMRQFSLIMSRVTSGVLMANVKSWTFLDGPKEARQTWAAV